MARTRAQDYGTKRQAILHNAAELFARYGYPGTSINMIATACGVSKALLYHYYPDKEEVLFDMLSSHLAELVAAVDAAAGSTDVPAARLEAMAVALLEAYRDADAMHQVQLSSLKLLPEARQAALRDMERAIVAAFSDAIGAAIPKASEGHVLKPLTMSLMGMLNWHYLWFREGKGISRAAYARMASAMVLEGAEAAVAAASTKG